MPTLQATTRVSFSGKSFQQILNDVTNGSVIVDPTIAAAAGGSLTTRTSNTIGTLTMTSASHGIATGNLVDIYWADDGSGVAGKRNLCVAGSVSGTLVPFTGGTGDNLPPADTVITAMVPSLETFELVYTGMQALGLDVQGNNQASASLLGTSTSDVNLTIHSSANTDYIWTDASGIANPLSENITQVYLSHGDSTAARQVSLAAAYN